MLATRKNVGEDAEGPSCLRYCIPTVFTLLIGRETYTAGCKEIRYYNILHLGTRSRLGSDLHREGTLFFK